MPLKQEGLTLQMKKPEKDNFFKRTGATKGPAPGGKVLLPGGGGDRFKTFDPKFNFEEIKKKFDATGKLDLQDFDNAKDIGLFLDWYNKGIRDKEDTTATNEILEINKFLVKSMTRKIFLMKRPKNDV